MIIYRVTNKINNKKYIGKTIQNLNERKRQHLKKCEWIRNTNSILYKAFRKYGKENFNWDIIYECNNLEELNKKEIYYIKKYNTYKNGYNCTLGGDGGDTLSNHPNIKEICRKKSISMIGKNAGDKNPAKRKEVRNKISKTIIKIQEGGKNSPTNKKWKITFSDGKIETTKWFKKWCENNNWKYGTAVAYRRRNKKYKGCVITQV